MLDWIMSHGCSPIGLDVGTSSIKMVQLDVGGSKPSIIASGQYALPADAKPHGPEHKSVLIEGIRKLLDSSPFRGRHVVAGLPNAIMQFRNVRLPQMPPAEQADAVQWEAAERLQIKDTPTIVKYLSAGEVRQGEDVRDELILMAVAQQEVDARMHTLIEAGLTPVALEPAPLSIARCYARLYRRESDQTEVRVHLEVGRTASSVAILRGSRVMFYKTVAIGGRSIDQSVAEHLDLSLDDAPELRRKLIASEGGEAGEDDQLFGSTRRENVRRAVYEAVRPIVGELANEVALCLRYFAVTFRGKRPTHVFLSGGEAHDPTLLRVMREQLEATVELADPLDGVDLSSDQVAIERRGCRAQWTIATGLALRQPPSAAARLRGAA